MNQKKILCSVGWCWRWCQIFGGRLWGKYSLSSHASCTVCIAWDGCRMEYFVRSRSPSQSPFHCNHVTKSQQGILCTTPSRRAPLLHSSPSLLLRLSPSRLFSCHSRFPPSLTSSPYLSPFPSSSSCSFSTLLLPLKRLNNNIHPPHSLDINYSYGFSALALHDRSHMIESA